MKIKSQSIKLLKEEKGRRKVRGRVVVKKLFISIDAMTIICAREM